MYILTYPGKIPFITLMFKDLKSLLAGCIVAVGLVSCGGGGEGDPGPSGPGTVGTQEKQVSYTTTRDGCLSRNNADADVRYLIGDKPARYLIWNCGNHDIHKRQRVRVFAPYNYDIQCYTPASEHVDFGRCNNPTPTPETPLFSARSTNFSVTPVRSAEGTPGFSYNFEIRNDGNVPAFDLRYAININRTEGAASGTIDVIEPGTTYVRTPINTYSQNYAGQSFILDLAVFDPFDSPISTGERQNIRIR